MDNYSWLRDVIKFSLSASTSTTPFTLLNQEPPPPHYSLPPQGDSPRQRLIDGIVYSRSFILTYHIFVLASICVLSALHWNTKLVRWRRRRALRWQSLRDEDVPEENEEEDIRPIKTISWVRKEAAGEVEEISSSGSSATEGTASPTRKDIDEDEESPLLPPQRTVPPRTFISSFRAFLMYQPTPIPFFNKLMPSNGTSIFILLFLGLNLFYCSYNMEFSLRNVFVLADRWGLMIVANLPLLYILAAKNQPLKFLTGHSYESLNIFHRRLGELLCLQALFHGLAMTTTWYIIIRPTGRLNFVQYILLPVTYFGLGAFFSYELLYLTALASFRQKFYELFLAIHIVLQTLALLFVYFHHPVCRIYVLTALLIFLTDRLLFRLLHSSTTLTIQARILLDGETILLTSTLPLTPTSQFSLKNSIANGWSPTSHVFITAPALSPSHVLQAHPFTISSAAPIPGIDTSATLSLLIRAQNGFSRDLLNYTHRHNTLTLRIDGPYGSSHALDLLSASSLAIVIGGGSGIAVAWPLISHLIHLSTENESAIMKKRKIVLIWVVHEETHLSWLSPSDLEYAKTRGVEIVIPRPTEEVGRPDLRGVIGSVVEMGRITKGERIGVVVSGPDGMGRLVRNVCSELVGEGRDVGVQVEKFGW